MAEQQKFQIVSAGKVLRDKAVGEVLTALAERFAITTQQARKLFLKGWVIKDQLSPAEVIQYRTQLQQIGLKIEVHPAGKFDNRALLARVQFAQKRQARKVGRENTGAAHVVGGSVVGANVVREKVSSTANAGSSRSPSAQEPKKPLQIPPVSPVSDTAVSLKQVSVSVAASDLNAGDNANQSAPPSPQNTAIRKQLSALFTGEQGVSSTLAKTLSSGNIRLMLAMPAAALVPLLMALVALATVYQAATALWKIPTAVLQGTSMAGALVGTGLSLLVLAFFAAMFWLPYYRAGYGATKTTLRLEKNTAPGLFQMLELLSDKVQVPVPQGVRVHRGAETEVLPNNFLSHMRGEFTLSIGLSSVVTLNGGDNLALIARALGYYQTRCSRLATWLLVVPAKRLQSLQEALENGQSILSDNSASGVTAPLRKVMAACGLVVVPVVERLQAIHYAASRQLGRVLAERADSVAACLVGSEGFSAFVSRWHQLSHAELVTGEINREAQLVGKCLADFPAAVNWLYHNLDKETRASIELAMEDTADLWQLAEPADIARVYKVEDRKLASLLQRTDFNFTRLFADFQSLSARVSRLDVDDHCRAVENQLLMSASKETEEAQRILVAFFNRIVPADLLPLQLPISEDLQRLDLQRTVDWLRSRLIELQDQEQRLASLQVQGAKMQLGAGLIRVNFEVTPADYCLGGIARGAIDESIRDNHTRLQDCMQQRGQIISMFYQRILHAVEGMTASGQRDCQVALERLTAYEYLREPLVAVGRYGDLISVAIDRLPVDKIPQPLLQKYVTLALQQCEILSVAVRNGAAELGVDLADRLDLFNEARERLVAEGQRDPLTRLQAVELHCKNLVVLVMESYHQCLAGLLQVCLAEEQRRNIRPLRLAGAL
ncbi:hypothetical protein PVT68_01075 [Microbulbifer bruguierae]|uniref:Peptidase M48 domain-containing protein n=1 Tax=Microbulbifer bruguierae TaxID=3029061 RepID=A0ABY8NDA8_9GAMM|nr:hypothetical protein [Microbulbifer bruguierae]WGL16906.1 hypothetical protein PVT68_01075 [Microbulbifer bruguierae]